MLGDLHCYLTKKTEINDLGAPHNYVGDIDLEKSLREEESQKVLQR